jgi:hypothetical protein
MTGGEKIFFEDRRYRAGCQAQETTNGRYPLTKREGSDA